MPRPSVVPFGPVPAPVPRALEESVKAGPEDPSSLGGRCGCVCGRDRLFGGLKVLSAREPCGVESCGAPKVVPPAGDARGTVAGPVIGRAGCGVMPESGAGDAAATTGRVVRVKSRNRAPPVAVPAIHAARSALRPLSAGGAVWAAAAAIGAATSDAARNLATVIFTTQGSEHEIGAALYYAVYMGNPGATAGICCAAGKNDCEVRKSVNQPDLSPLSA